MNAQLHEHEAEWLAPAPLWATDGVTLRAPALVRIDGDEFMDQFTRMLTPGPHRAARLWDARPGTKSGDKSAGVLYQPLHGCYALACASLTCRAAGRPEKAVAPARGDAVGFVLRRLEETGGESAWIPAGDGQGSWRPVRGREPEDGEELIPMFPVPADGSLPRRIWAGLVPTASRETYQPGAPAPGALPEEDRRLSELDSGPLEAIKTVPVFVPSGNPATDEARRKVTNSSALQAVWALAEFLNEYILPLDDVAKDKLLRLLESPGRRGSELVQALSDAKLIGAMKFAWSHRAALLGTEGSVPEFDLATAGLTLPVRKIDLNNVRKAIADAPPVIKTPVGKQPGGAARPRFDLNLNRKYVVRCVYLRTGCPAVTSAASEEFAIAPVHDPDAPARTIRIPMPIDTSPAGLRKFKKNVGFVLSAALNAQVQSLSGKKLKDIDEGNVSAGGIGLGEVCSFALPIITLCAMIVLFIFLALLNIVFFWMPFLKICLPIPKQEES